MKKKSSHSSPRIRREKDKIRRSGDQDTSNTPTIEDPDEIGEIIDDALIDLAVGDDAPTTSNLG
jgi:hypothetical protein